jgi:hypothetical protein
MITQDILKSHVHYNPETGLFTWLVSKTHNVKIGQVTGCINTDGYLRIMINRKSYLAHRLAWLYMYGNFPLYIDHINEIKSDNKIVNLRECKKSENLKNIGMLRNNTSGFKGVSWNKGKWQVRAKLNGKSHYLGMYQDINDAANAYKEFARKNHGEFLHSSLKETE